MSTQTPGPEYTIPQSPFIPAGPPPKKRSRMKLFIVLAVIGALLSVCFIGVIAAALNSGSSKPAEKPAAKATAAQPTAEQPKAAEPTKPAAATTKPAAAPPANQLNKPVRDGKFEFTVTGVYYGIAIQGQTPQGQFVAVTVTVKNIGKEPQTMFDGNQEALSANGAKYRADSAAGLYLNSADQSVWITPINPGNAVAGKIVFDVPRDVKLAKLKLHDSMLSGGVTLTIG